MYCKSIKSICVRYRKAIYMYTIKNCKKIMFDMGKKHYARPKSEYKVTLKKIKDLL